MVHFGLGVNGTVLPSSRREIISRRLKKPRLKKGKKTIYGYLHHEEDGVEHNEGHDEVLEGRGDDDPPELVLEAVPLPGHVAFKWLRVDREVNTGLLQYTPAGLDIYFSYLKNLSMVILHKKGCKQGRADIFG